MMIIGCDFQPSWQKVSWLDTETGETGERKLVQASGDAERFYRQAAGPAVIGMEATGNCHWLVDLLSELGHELWVGDAAQIRASYVRQQKTDQRDAAHLLKLLVEGRFPRIWMPSSEVRDLRQLLLHRYKLVIIRARVKNELQHLCLNKGVQRKHKLWSQAGQQILRELPLKPWAGRRRDDLLKLMAMLDQQIEPLDQAVKAEAQRDKMGLLLQTEFRREYLHRCHQKPKAVAKVAAARKLAVRLYWMLRTQRPYPAVVRIESSPRVPLVGAS